ncbi:MAG: sarcosine oxidase subunit beta family protein [Devosiaceae bacterium]|nr:sarcosine oxidase subunit beta family protein [Devosiaceae bacterium]
MTRFSLSSLITNGLNKDRLWDQQWEKPEPEKSYDVIIIGAGGHGLAAAYYLAKEHNITNVAVLEKGWLGGGNTARNTTVIRSNYLYDESAKLYDHALKLWEGLSQELNYNLMFSQRGVMMLAHSAHEVASSKRHVHANRANGIDNEWLSAEQAKEFCPPLNISARARYPVLGAALQRRAGTARHDGVAWGYARAASARGVHLIENCEVTGINRNIDGSVCGVQTTRGTIDAKKIAISAAAGSGALMQMVGVNMPLESFTLQALVSEPIAPVFPCLVASNTVHAYISQSAKGELVIGAGTEQYISYTQRGPLHTVEHTLAAICEMFPIFTRLKMLRNWGGWGDVTPDRSPILGKTPVPGLYLNTGWGTGGFKATPGAGHLLAHTIARDAPHDINAPFTLKRFQTGRLIDEAAAAAVAH